LPPRSRGRASEPARSASWLSDKQRNTRSNDLGFGEQPSLPVTSMSEQMHTILQRLQLILDALNIEKSTY